MRRLPWTNQKQSMKLALFGGTFDPIHNAHLTVAREAAGQFHFDQVWFVPAAHPPHKSDNTGATYEDRFRMVELACQVDPRFVASDLEKGGQQELFPGHRGTRACPRRAAILHHRCRCLRGNHKLAPLAGIGPADRIHSRHTAGPPVRDASWSQGTSIGDRCSTRILLRSKEKTGCGRDPFGVACGRGPLYIGARSLPAGSWMGGAS